MPDADTSLCKLSLGQVSEVIRKREVSPVELLEATLARIDGEGEVLNAYITICREEALHQAREAERAIGSGDYLGPLHGVPVAHKDIVATSGIRTTCGSRVFRDQVPDQDATIVERLNGAGAVMVGKLGLYEFACAPPNPLFGATRNPWDLERDTGGSSSGSAAAIAAYLCHAAIGTDTGGSIRSPASLCGIVGLKQTYGRVSRHGVFPLSWSLDHAGPMTRTVEDAALVLQAIAGYDPKDTSTVDLPVPDYRRALTGEVRGLKAGIPREYFFKDLGPGIGEVVDRAIRTLEDAGMSIEEVALPHADYIQASWWGVFAPEAAAIHTALMRDSTDDYAEPVLNMVGPGHFLPAAVHMKADQARTIITAEMNDVLRRVDVLLTPTSPIVAWKPEDGGRLWNRVTDVIGTIARFTAPFNLTGHPAISVPCGLSPEGLPVGFQIAGRAFDEETVLRVAHAYESLAPFPVIPAASE
jgi:aspartyl-tRNA(Asn)/glutamyl-tRNA(Gln) amidotransferase subunit A